VTGSSGDAALAEERGGTDAGAAGVRHYVERIWHVRGRVELPPGQSAETAFARLDPLFQQTGTRHERNGDTLTFAKKDPASQDRMASWDSGVLRIAASEGGLVLRYHLVSRMMLFCFLMPLVFLGFAQLAISFGKAEPPEDKAAATAKPGDKAKKPEKKDDPELKLNPVDEFLGAPAPETKAEREKKKKEKKNEPPEKKPSPTPAYVFAGIFAALYLVGRFLEPWLVNRLFRRRLWEDEDAAAQAKSASS
jgi:hypothetical protein